jgi:PIN domain nuclease of toxin-antitoxin system
VKLLLDTHAFLWWQEDSKKLGADARRAIERAEVVFISAASAWEVAIKVGLGKLRIPGPFAEAVEASQFSALPIAFEHAALIARLPRHHSDPFDRTLIAQAIVEGATVVTHDAQFEAYAVPLLMT